MSTVTQIAKSALLSIVGAITRRTPVLLSADAAGVAPRLSVFAPYRVGPDVVEYFVNERTSGDLRVSCTWRGADGAASQSALSHPGPGIIQLRLRDGMVVRDGIEAGSVSSGKPIASRRFDVSFELRGRDGSLRRRVTGHYQPRDGQPIDEHYYYGEDYVDYDAQGEDVHREVLELIRRHHIAGPVLEIGCAMGGTLEVLRREGFEVSGIDFSGWAIERARTRLGDVVCRANPEHDPVPELIVKRGPFGCFVLAAVLEHFADPRAVLESLAPLAAPGAAIVILTTNAKSLTSRVFEKDWEGYFDWTHKGVDIVTVPWLRACLAALGWDVREIETYHLWDGSADPTHATFRDWFAADARFRTLLAERDLGDFIRCVAVRRP